MSRCLMAWEIGGHLGHVARLAPIAEGLRRRGCSVRLALREPDAILQVDRHFNVDVEPAPTGQPLPGEPASLCYADVLRRNGYWSPEATGDLIGRWLALCGRVQPDIVVAEHSPGALLAARLLGVPAVALGSGYSVPPLTSPMPTVQPWFDVDDRELQRREARLLEAVNPALRRLGGQPLENAAGLFAGVRRFVCTFASLDHYAGRPAGECVGPIFGVSGEAAAWPHGHGPRVFAYGRGARLRRAIAQAIDRGCRAVVLHPDMRGVPPDPAMLACDYPVRIDLLAPSCDLAICESPGTATRFLLAGVPVLLLPCHIEQQMWADNSARQGLAVVVSMFSADADAAQAGALDQALADDEMRQRVRLFASRHAGYDDRCAVESIIAACDR